MMKEKRTFREAATDWLKYQKDRVSHASLSTYSNRIAIMLPVVGELNVDENRLILDQMQSNLKANKPSTKVAVLQLVNRILEFDQKGYEAQIIPKEKSDITLISKEQFDVLKKYVLEDVTPNNLGILCVMYTGLKIGELCALKWSDIDLTSGFINVRRSLNRINAYEGNKSKTILEEIGIIPRDIPIPTKFLRILLTKSMQVEKYLVTCTSEPVEPRTLDIRLKVICKRLSIPAMSYGSLRDYFAVNALTNGVNAFVLSDIMGIEYRSMVKYFALAKGSIDPELEVEKLNNI